jgi:hypothetical protein
MRRPFSAAGLLVLCTAILGTTLFQEQVAQAAQLLKVKVMNTSVDPVPVSPQAADPVSVSLQAPTLRAFAQTINGADGPVEIPTGVVVTDVVVSSGDPDCTVVSIGNIETPGGAAPLPLSYADARRANGAARARHPRPASLGAVSFSRPLPSGRSVARGLALNADELTARSDSLRTACLNVARPSWPVPSERSPLCLCACFFGRHLSEWA